MTARGCDKFKWLRREAGRVIICGWGCLLDDKTKVGLGEEEELVATAMDVGAGCTLETTIPGAAVRRGGGRMRRGGRGNLLGWREGGAAPPRISWGGTGPGLTGASAVAAELLAVVKFLSSCIASVLGRVPGPCGAALAVVTETKGCWKGCVEGSDTPLTAG